MWGIVQRPCRTDNPLRGGPRNADDAGMRRLHYSGGVLLTADATCKAVLRYARALAESDNADVISIPVLEDGTVVQAHLLIGPASQIYSTPVLGGEADEPLDREVVEELEARTRRLDPSTPAWPDEMTDVNDLDFDL